MRKSVRRTVYIAGVFLMLTAAATQWYQWSNEEQEYDHSEGENEEEEHKDGRLAGVDKQLATWFWSKGYPNPVGLNGKYERAWKQHLALQEHTRQIRQKAHIGYKSNNSDELLMGIKPKSIAPIQESVSEIVAGRGGLGTWKAVGPKAFGGRILSIAINRVNNVRNKRTIYAGSASGGIWRSYVGGEGADAWHPVNTNTPVLGVSSIVYHPSDTNILYAGTGEVYRVEKLGTAPNETSFTGNIGMNVWKARGTYGIGVLKTTDGGKTWQRLLIRETDDLFAVQKIRIDPVNHNRIYACATDGLWRSNDGGVSWTRVFTATYVSDVAINPLNNNIVVVAAGNLMNTTKGIWRTTDGFATAPTKAGSPIPTTFKGKIQFDYLQPTSTTTMLVASVATGASTGAEIFSSNNFGSSWTSHSGSAFSSYQYWFANDIEINPAATTQIVAGGVDLYSFNTGTNTRTSISTGGSRMDVFITNGGQEGSANTYVHSDIHDIEYVPGMSNTFYVACDGGIFLTTNNGSSYTTCNGGLMVHQFYGPIAQSQSNGNYFIGGLQDNNVIRSNPTNTGWSREIGGDGGPCMFVPGTNEMYVIASRDARAIYHSTNGGSSFGEKLQNMGLSFTPAADERTGFMAPIAVGPAGSSPTTNTKIYVASDNIHVSLNSGGAFNKNTPSSMTTYIDAQYKTALALAVSPYNADKLYVSVSPIAQRNDDGLRYNPPANVLKSLNGGNNFTAIKNTLPDRFVMDFAISPTNDDSVFVALGGFGTAHIYVTGNGGASWVPLGNNVLPDAPVNAIMFDPNNPKIIYAGSDLGVYVSPDRGANWLDYSSGFWDATYVIDLVVAPGENNMKMIRAVTHGKGIFESPLLELSTLPVTFNSFKGQKQEQHNLLQWTVSEESQLESYQVEKSTDGITYKTVATVRARNLDGTQVYEYKDHQVGGSFYYRIKSVDLDGTYQYSSVIFLNRSNGEKMTLMVNPVTTTIPLQFHVLQKGTVALRLVNNAGQVIRAAQASLPAGTSNYNLSDLQSLPQGVYYLEATFNRQRWVEKVVKN